MKAIKWSCSNMWMASKHISIDYDWITLIITIQIWKVSTINTNKTIAKAIGSLCQSLDCIVFCSTGLDFVGNLLDFCIAQRVSRQEEVLLFFQWNWSEAFRVSHNGRWWNEWKANGKITSKCLPSSVKWKSRQTSMQWCKGGRGLLSSKQTLWPTVSEVFDAACSDTATTVK